MSVRVPSSDVGLRLVLLALFAVLVPVGVASGETIHRRGGLDPIIAARVDLRPDGVLSIKGNDASQVIPWDLVRSIEDIRDASVRDGWERMKPMAEDLWRARSRVQRGDTRLAEPLFERHFERMLNEASDSELRLIISEGLLRVLLARGAFEEALPAALETIRLRRAGVTTDRYAFLPEVIDRRFWLVPALPPISTSKRMTALLPEVLRPWLEGEDPYVQALASGYASLAGVPKEAASGGGASGPGLGLIGAAREAVASDPEIRSDARARLALAVDADDAPLWVDAWARWFNARSVLLEPDPDLDLALIELLHIPAMHGARCPALASRAVSRAAEMLEAAGRTAEANQLRHELKVSQANVSPAFVPLEPVSSDDPIDGSETP